MMTKHIHRFRLRHFFVAAVVTGLTCGLVHAQESTPGVSGWLTFRGNPEHTGTTDLIGPPEEIEMKWRWRVHEEIGAISASPAVTADGAVYAATESGYAGMIPAAGGPGWIYDADGLITSSPSVTSDGSVLVMTADGYLYYLDKDAALQWKSDFSVDIATSPVVSGTTAYIGTDDKTLLAVNLDPDLSESLHESGKISRSEVVLWSYAAQGTVKSSPAFAGNTVFFGGGNYLYAINPTGGGDNASSSSDQESRLKWRYDINASIYSSPAVYGGTVYVGADDGYLYAFSENVTGDTQEGELLWKRRLGNRIRSSPAVADRDGKAVIYVGCDDGKLYAYDENGEAQWTFATSGRIRSSPAVDGAGDIYFGSDDGKVYALFNDGSLKWQFATGSSVRSSPAIGPDMLLYVGSEDGYLYCIGESTEEDREIEFAIAISKSLTDIENDGNPTTISAKVTSATEPESVLARIASMEIDLSTLNLTGCNEADEECAATGPVTVKNMLDDGKDEDDLPGDGTFTFAFGVTEADDERAYENGIFTYAFADGFPGIGPVPLMVTVTDLNGKRTSKPFALNIAHKVASQTAPYAYSVVNSLKDQDITISFTSFIEEPSILSITPSQGTPGQRLNVTIVGRNTNFEKNTSRVDIRNDNGTLLAYARPEKNDVEVLSDTVLTANLNIYNSDQIPAGEALVGKWDVQVITGDEVASGKELFTITGGSSARSMPEDPPLQAMRLQTEDACVFSLDVFQLLDNATMARAKGSPWTIRAEYPRDITIESAQGGTWYFEVIINQCSSTPTFKIITKGDRFGYLVGEVRDGITGAGVDNATVFALTGRDIGQDSTSVNIEDLIQESTNKTVSAGGGYYMLPLAAAQESYTVIAEKDGIFDIEREVAITQEEEVQLNFSLQADSDCPVSDLALGSRIGLFYRFRDSVLSTTDDGKRWISLYYRFAPEVRLLMAGSPGLENRIRRLAQRAVRLLPALLDEEPIEEGLEADVRELMDLLFAQGSPQLVNALRAEREHILSFIRMCDRR